MKVKTILLTSIATLAVSSATVFAAAGSPVTHSHDGRSHSHPLPETGKNHTHGGKKKTESVEAGSGWTNFSISNNYFVDFKNGSYAEEKNKAGDVIGTLIIKTRWKTKDKIELEKIYVTKKDCLKGLGTVVSLEVDGTYITDFSFAEGAGTIASSMARVTCQFFKEADSKSL